MHNEGETITQPESDASDLSKGAFASITIQAEDLRPFILRRWSARAIAGTWSLDDPSFGTYYLRARSREKLVAKGIKKLRRKALRLGIENPVINVADADALSSVGVRQPLATAGMISA